MKDLLVSDSKRKCSVFWFIWKSHIKLRFAS